MLNRRHFFRRSLPLLAGAALWESCAADNTKGNNNLQTASAPIRPVVISTWPFGAAANTRAWEILQQGGSALDAVEAGVMITEADPNNHTVGIGGFPDRDGIVTLDACIMNHKGDCGSVAALQDILHPVQVARMVMEKSPHIMLVGQGAQDFALANGLEKTELLTPEAKAAWEEWKKNTPNYRPPINIENHDTIGMLALDQAGNLSGACTTSGAAYKYHGRVGDSPLIGAGLYVDNEVGAATATGWGEAVIRACGTFLVVEFMRQGHSPTDACRLAVERVISKNEDWKDIQVGFIALNKQGETGGYCIQSGFSYALHTPDVKNDILESKYIVEANH